MAEAQLALIRGDHASQDVEFRDRLPVNGYAVAKPIYGVAGYMVTHPGVTQYSNGVGRDRGANYNERFGRQFRVSGDKLIEVKSDQTAIVLGNIDEGSIHCPMPYSFNTQAIISNKKMWLYDNSTLIPITDDDLGPVIDGCWVNGYYFLTDGEYLYHSELTEDPPSDPQAFIEPIKFATSEFSPDPTLGVAKTEDNQVIVFNRYTTEFFVNLPGDTGFVFQRIESKAVKAGIIGTHLKVELKGDFYCLGSSKEEAPTMLIIGGGGSKSFSTREIDKILRSYTEAELAEGVMEARIDDRDHFIYVRLPRHTLLFNAGVAATLGIQNAWTILRSTVETDGVWIPVNGVFDRNVNRWVYGERDNSRIGVLNDTIALQYGEPTEVIYYSNLVDIEDMSIDELEVRTIPGQQIEQVRLFLSLTHDQGVTYGREWSLDYSETRGDYLRRAIFRRLGYVHHTVGVKLRCVANLKTCLSAMVIDYG